MEANSKFLKLKSKDFWKGLIVAVLMSAFTAAYEVVKDAQDLASFNWDTVILAGIAGLMAYLTKNLFTNSDGQPFKAEK